MKFSDYIDFQFIHYESSDHQSKCLSDLVSEQLEAALSKKKNALLVVPGGSTPKVFFDKLSHEKLNWENVVVIPTDERQVSQSSVRSNARLIHQTLLQNEAKKAQFIALFSDQLCNESLHSGKLSNESLADFLKKQQELIKPYFPIDVCILGMGNDGHTASLFPNTPQLEEALTTDELLIEIKADHLEEPRVSLSAKTLLSATYVHILIQGDDKIKTLEKVLSSPDYHQMPVRLFTHAKQAKKILSSEITPKVWIHFCS